MDNLPRLHPFSVGSTDTSDSHPLVSLEEATSTLSLNDVHRSCEASASDQRAPMRLSSSPPDTPPTPPADPLVVLGFDVVYEILSYLTLGDILNLQATSKAWHGALGGCKSLWRRRIAAVVSARRLQELDNSASNRAKAVEQEGRPLEPFEVSKFLRGACLEEYSPSRSWNQGRYSHFKTPAHPARLITVDRDCRLTFALAPDTKDTEKLSVRDLFTGQMLSCVKELPVNGSLVAGHGYVVIWWATQLQDGVYPVAPASYIQVYRVGYGSRFSHKRAKPINDVAWGEVELVKSIAGYYWLYGATLHIETGPHGPRTTLALIDLPSKLSNDRYRTSSLHGTSLGLSFDPVPPHWTADRSRNRHVHFYDLELGTSEPYSILDLGKFGGFYRNITIDDSYAFLTSDATMRIHSRTDPDFHVELSLRSNHLLSSSKLTVQLQRYQEIEVWAAANQVYQRMKDGEGGNESRAEDLGQLITREVARNRQHPTEPQDVVHSTYQKEPERYTKVSVAERHLVITTVKGKIVVIYNYRSLLDSLLLSNYTENQVRVVLRDNMMVISTDSNVLDLSTYRNKIGIRLSKTIGPRREDFLLLLDGRYLPDLKNSGNQVRLKSWAIVAPINRSVLGCGREAGGMVIDDYRICLPGIRKFHQFFQWGPLQ